MIASGFIGAGCLVRAAGLLVATWTTPAAAGGDALCTFFSFFLVLFCRPAGERRAFACCVCVFFFRITPEAQNARFVFSYIRTV